MQEKKSNNAREGGNKNKQEEVDRKGMTGSQKAGWVTHTRVAKTERSPKQLWLGGHILVDRYKTYAYIRRSQKHERYAGTGELSLIHISEPTRPY